MPNLKNRFSLYRDASGYINYRVIDKNGNIFIVSSDVSSWVRGEQHHVAASWVLNSTNKQDEMHLFIDGKEVPTILKYGGSVSPLLHQKFRTVSTEDMIGVIPKSIVGSTDLVTTFGLTTVSSSLNFTDLNINVGDTLYVEEESFNINGYLITNVNGNTLTLSTIMPLSATNCKFSVNKTSFIVSTEINLYKNITVSVLHLTVTGSDLVTTFNNIASSLSQNFTILGVSVGDLLKIDRPGFADYYTITGISDNTLTLSDDMPIAAFNSSFSIYSIIEEELPGQNALFPSYEVSRDIDFNNILTIKAGVEANDIILIQTLGLNHSRTKNKYYIWGNTSNIINTRLPSPLLLDDVKIYHTLLDTLVIGPSNSTLSAGIFTSSNISTDQPSVSDNGRTLSLIISGDNIDYSSSISVLIDGIIDGVPATETVTFSENTTKDTVGKISLINFIVVTCTPINTARGCCTIKIKEKEVITTAEDSTSVPVIRYSYQMLVGNTLAGTSGSNVVSDSAIQFSNENIGNYLTIYTPAPVAGQYLITDVSEDLLTITLSTSLVATFTNGNYEILNITPERSGLQNGRFTFEEASTPGVPYLLSQGLYEFDYHTSLSIPLEAANLKGFIGSDLNKDNQSKAIIDDFFILNTKLSDTRIGETIASGQDSITKRYNSLKAASSNQSTLMLLNLDNDFINNTDTYLTSTKDFIQSSVSVNNNFNKSIVFTDKPLIISNTGILNTKKEGTIDFWINPLIDSGNDKNYRFYFDASSASLETVLSSNNATVKLIGRASSILNIKLKNGTQSIDYFAGGVIDSDSQTLYLNKRLPSQNTEVIVAYIPTGVSGDRMSIYKDPSGYLNFNITASGTDHQVCAPIFWEKGSWHKIRAQYIMNQGLGTDEMRLFIDGYEYGNIIFGNGLLFGEALVFGSTYVGSNLAQSNISFTDIINEISIGSDYTGILGAQALIDNLRISNISRPITKFFGEAIDTGYSSNLSLAFPATEDLYTTLLLDFNSLIKKTTNFSIIKNKVSGNFDITIYVDDGFNILRDNEKSKLVLEDLLNALKPANSRLFLIYK